MIKTFLRYLPRALVFAIIAIVAMFAIQIIGIQLRLWRNGDIGEQLVNSLQEKYPKATFRSAASYEKEVIYIFIRGGIDEKERPNIARWLREQKRTARTAR